MQSDISARHAGPLAGKRRRTCFNLLLVEHLLLQLNAVEQLASVHQLLLQLRDLTLILLNQLQPAGHERHGHKQDKSHCGHKQDKSHCGHKQDKRDTITSRSSHTAVTSRTSHTAVTSRTRETRSQAGQVTSRSQSADYMGIQLPLSSIAATVNYIGFMQKRAQYLI